MDILERLRGDRGGSPKMANILGGGKTRTSWRGRPKNGQKNSV